MERILNSCLELARGLLRQQCLLCDAPSGRNPVCAGCEAGFAPLPKGCPRCAMPSPSGAPCGACLARPPAFDGTFAAWPYRFPLDRLVQAFKFRGRLQLAPWFARALAPGVPPGADAIVALPLHPSRLAERGFNQAQEIARTLAPLSGLPLLCSGVRRTRATGEQARLPHEDREGNVRGAFACDTDFTGRTIVVIDDVMTTGATLHEFARTLKQSGATRVVNCVVARALFP